MTGVCVNATLSYPRSLRDDALRCPITPTIGVNHMPIQLGAIALCLSLTAGLQAASHTVHAIHSGQTTPSSNWGSCCGTYSMSSNPTSIIIEDCTYMGGYCMGDSKKGAWLFEIPSSLDRSLVTDIAVTGQRSGAYGSGHIYLHWHNAAQMTVADVNDAMSTPDLLMPINWPGSSTYSFPIPTSVLQSTDQQYLLVVARTNVESPMTLTNYGTGRTHLLINTSVGMGACCASNGVCFEAEQLSCENVGFTFLGEGVECTSNTCTTCAGDYDESGAVDIDDLLSLLAVFGTANDDHDLNGDGMITVDDLLVLIAAFGNC